MESQVQGLIDKIKTEGIQEAEQKAGEIEQQAQSRGQDIINKAKQRADELIVGARQESKKIREATQTVLLQASRDMLLNLRKEIETILERIVAGDIHKALTPEELSGIIEETVKGYLAQNSDVSDITVTLASRDLKKLKEGFIAKLKTKIKQPITFQSADDMGAGFTISFDNGKSCFDFTDKSLVEYLGGYLNAEVSSLLKKTISS